MKIKLASLVVLMGVFVGCSSDSGMTENNNPQEAKALENIDEKLNSDENESHANQTMSTITVSDFLAYKYGGQEEIVDTLTVNVEGLGERLLVKVAVENNDMIDAYLSADPETLEMIRFTEFDWQTGTLTARDFEGEETNILSITTENIFYTLRTDPLVVIYDPPENQTNGRFWGWSCDSDIDEGGDGVGGGNDTTRCCYYALSFKIDCKNGYSMNDLPGRNPKFEHNPG